jgi:DNA-binding beta-propeller fold protein YncE
MIGCKSYYIRIQADDNFIYTSRWGKEPWGRNEIPPINTILMLDWQGNLINEFITDQPVHEIWLDQVRNRLYTTNMATDEVFYLDLNQLNIK